MMEPSESKRVYEELIRDIRPVVDMARDQYAQYLTQYGCDDEKAFHAMIVWMNNLQASHGANLNTYIALCAFMARRLQYHVPRLKVSAN